MKNLKSTADVQPQQVPQYGAILDDESRRTMQETITVSLIGFLGAIFVFLFVGVLFSAQAGNKDVFEHLKEVLTLVMGPLVTLLSTVVGFYFGAKIARDAEGIKNDPA